MRCDGQNKILDNRIYEGVVALAKRNHLRDDAAARERRMRGAPRCGNEARAPSARAVWQQTVMVCFKGRFPLFVYTPAPIALQPPKPELDLHATSIVAVPCP